MNRRISEGFAVGLLALLAGLWLTWRGWRGDIWRDLFGVAVIPRWLYLAAGLALTALSAVYLIFLWRATHG